MSEKELSQELFEKIESYLLNQMPEDERVAFEKDIDIDRNLKAEVSRQKDLMLAAEVQGMKSKLNRIHGKQTGRKSPTVWYSLAASIVLIIAVGSWWIVRPTASERIFSDYASFDPGLPVPMSATDDYDFYDAMVDYKSGDYETAIEKWNALSARSEVNDTLTYYIASAYFNAEKYKEAIDRYQRVIALDSETYAAKSEWFLGLSYLKLNEIDKLKQLAADSHPENATRFNEILERLE